MKQFETQLHRGIYRPYEPTLEHYMRGTHNESNVINALSIEQTN